MGRSTPSATSSCGSTIWQQSPAIAAAGKIPAVQNRRTLAGMPPQIMYDQDRRRIYDQALTIGWMACRQTALPTSRSALAL